MDQNFINLVSSRLYETINTENKEVDLKDLGLDSFASIELILEIEEYYNITFPDESLTSDTFKTAESLWNTVEQLI